MRYYDITIGSATPAGGGNSSSGSLLHYTSHPQGVHAPPYPGALNVELEIYQGVGHVPTGNSMVRVWGISIEDIGQGAVFGGQNVVVQGGMGVGLPLANPAQAGLLITGTAWQVFGNWQGTVMTLDVILIAGTNLAPPLAALPGSQRRRCERTELTNCQY